MEPELERAPASESSPVPRLFPAGASIPARLAERHEDFVVEELPSFVASGAGEHLLLEVEKRGLAAADLLRRLSRALDVSEREIGFAGRKDARAVTRQRVTVPARAEALLNRVESPELRVLSVARHDRKLRLGAHAGNRFRLRLGGVPVAEHAGIEERLTLLARRGLPNAFGPQRFGRTGAAAELGRALWRGDWRAYLEAWTAPRHAPPTEAARELHELLTSGERAAWRRAGRLRPELAPEYHGLARQLSRRPGDWSSAARAVDARTRRFHLSAFQAHVFNRLLAARLEDYDRPRRGDLLQLHPGRSLFPVTPEEDLELLEARAARGELSPTGPLFGARVPLSTDGPGALERELLIAEGVLEGRPAAPLGGKAPRGERRALRVPLRELEHRWVEEDLILGFVLPPGAYATAVVGELGLVPDSGGGS